MTRVDNAKSSVKTWRSGISIMILLNTLAVEFGL